MIFGISDVKNTRIFLTSSRICNVSIYSDDDDDVWCFCASMDVECVDFFLFISLLFMFNIARKIENLKNRKILTPDDHRHLNYFPLSRYVLQFFKVLLHDKVFFLNVVIIDNKYEKSLFLQMYMTTIIFYFFIYSYVFAVIAFKNAITNYDIFTAKCTSRVVAHRSTTYKKEHKQK